MELASHLAAQVYPARTFAYLLVTLLLLQLREGGMTLWLWVLGLILYPQFYHLVLGRVVRKPGDLKWSLVPDGFITGLLVCLVGFNLEATSVLLALLGISVVILGGARMLIVVLPVTGMGVATGFWILPRDLSGGESFYFAAFGVLVAYIIFVGLQVNRETSRLNRAWGLENSQRLRLENLRGILAPFVPSQLTEREHGRPQRKRLTVMFSDIEGFTRLMDEHDESQVAEFLNSHFSAVAAVAARHGGTLDKFIGDGVMVFFGDPVSEGPVTDAFKCLQMSIEMRAEFRKLARDWCGRQQMEPVQLRIGIHTGFCLVGDFGCDDRKDYTALGSTVNCASRLESAAGSDEILISEETWKLARHRIQVAPGGSLCLKGLAKPVVTYSLLGIDNRRPGTSLRLHQNAHEAGRSCSRV